MKKIRTLPLSQKTLCTSIIVSETKTALQLSNYFVQKILLFTSFNQYEDVNYLNVKYVNMLNLTGKILLHFTNK